MTDSGGCYAELDSGQFHAFAAYDCHEYVEISQRGAIKVHDCLPLITRLFDSLNRSVCRYGRDGEVLQLPQAVLVKKKPALRRVLIWFLAGAWLRLSGDCFA
ncbi:hypothetical protein, partial [Brucella cytisi]|uniref:hypothetical protein n=1 Tax=Brucella cytisi TaxID=407152 RepID=UPI0035D9EA04